MSKKKIDSISSLTEQLSGIYENDSTLSYLKQFEDDRQSLLDLATSSWQEPTIQEKIEDMASALAMPAIQDAFKTHEDYKSYVSPILSSIHEKNYDSVLESIKLATEPYLKNDYSQTFKAAEMLNDTIEKADRLGITDHFDSYTAKLADLTLEYANNKSSATQGLVGLASAIDTDIFKKEMKSLSATESLATQAIEEVEKAKKSIIEAQDYHNTMLDTPMYKPPVFQTPKYEDTIMGKADKQVEVLEKLADYMITQTEKIELQNEIATDQNSKLKEQNKMIEDQVKDTARTSKIAFWTAISSISVAVIFSITGIGLTYYIFQEEDKSDNKNHAKMKTLIESNNNNKILGELVLQLKQQNKNSTIINTKLIKQNQYLKELLKAKK